MGTVTEITQLEFNFQIDSLLGQQKYDNLHNIYFSYTAIASKIKLIIRAIRYRIYMRSSFKAQA